MGKLLDDMTRLSGEITELRGTRRAFRGELAEGTRNRAKEVVEMCADFADTHTRTAERIRVGRLAFLKSLKQSVSDQQHDMRADLAGARRVWAGKGA